MWFWLLNALTIMLSPIALLFGRPWKGPEMAYRMYSAWGDGRPITFGIAGRTKMPAGHLVQNFTVQGAVVPRADSRLTTAQLRAAFPASGLAFAWLWKPWPWTAWLQGKFGAQATTVLGFIFAPKLVSSVVLAHESIHVIQQAAHPLLGPVGMYLTYLLDLVQWWSWRKVVPLRRSRAPLAEQIAYKVTGVDPW